MKDNTSLARLTEEGLRIQAIMESAEELNPEPDVLQKQLDAIEGQWLTKVENIGHYLQSMDYLDEVLVTEIERLKHKRESLKTRAEWLKGYVLQNMLSKGESKLQFPLITVSIATNPPSVEVVDEAAIPDAFLRVVPAHFEVNKLSIIANFKATGEIPAGCNVITNRKRLVVK